MHRTVVTWAAIARVADASNTAEGVFATSPRTPAVVAGFLHAVAAIPDWLVAAALAHKTSPLVADAVAARSGDLSVDQVAPLLRMRNDKVAPIIASSSFVARLPRRELEAFAYSVHPRVRMAFAANPATPSDLVVTALLGRDRKGVPLLRLRPLSKHDLLPTVLTRLSNSEVAALADSLFPEVLDAVLRARDIQAVDPSRILNTALTGLELCLARRRPTDRRVAGSYLKLFLTAAHLRHSPSAIREMTRHTQTVRSLWSDLAALDFPELRHLLRFVEVSGPLSDYFDLPNLDRLRSAVLVRTSVTLDEACEVFTYLASRLTSAAPVFVIALSRDTNLIVNRLFELLPPADLPAAFEALISTLPRDLAYFSSYRPGQVGPPPHIVDALPLDTAARYYRLTDLFAWPTEDLVAWLSTHGVSLPELLALDNSLSASHPAADLLAVLSPVEALATQAPAASPAA